MISTLLPVYLIWLLFQQAFAAPVLELRKQSIVKRATAGPKIDGANFPDPTIIYTDKWYSFATRTIGSNGRLQQSGDFCVFIAGPGFGERISKSDTSLTSPGIHVQIATSTDFVTWSIAYNEDGSQKDALPDLPVWVANKTAGASNVWAPDVNVLDDGSYIIYYSASAATDPTKHCVGAATSKSILGPYAAQPEALFCPLSQGGAIDAAGYRDPIDGKRYVVYKVDGNSLGNGGACGNTVAPLVPTPLTLQPVTSDGYTFNGSATTLLDHSGTSEDGDGTDDGIVEAPSLVKDGSTYFLFFSPGCFTTTHYRVAYATAPSITGPYTRSTVPLIQSGDDGLSGPGGADISKKDGFLLFHANSADGRALYTARVEFDGTTASVL